jgi:ABC-type transporter Mla subunit MlaD
MAKTFTPPVRFTRLVLKVNAFLLIALLLVAAFMGLVAYKQGWFIHQTGISFVTRNSLGINKGMPVKLYGFTIGTVSDMRLAQNGVAVKLSIISTYLERLPKGTRAKFARESGLVGTSVIEIIPGRGEQPLTEDEYIDFEPGRGISEIIDDFRRQAVPAFQEIKQVMSQFTRSGEEVTGAMITMRREMERIPETHRAVQKLLESATRATESATRASDSVARVSGAVERAVPTLFGKLATTLDSINGAAGEMQRTGSEAQDLLRRARPLLEHGENAARDAGNTARDAGEIIAAAKRVWPLRESFKQSDALLPIDSFEAYGLVARQK